MDNKPEFIEHEEVDSGLELTLSSVLLFTPPGLNKGKIFHF